MTGLVVLSPVNPADQVTHRIVTIVINGGAPITLDMIDPSLTFPVNPGDSVVATASDQNIVGSSPASAPFTAVAPLPPPTTVPATPTITAITFTP